MAGSTKAHQKYFVDGRQVPGVTTVINNLGWNKNALIAWARREGMAGNDPDKVRDKAADIGTLAHALIEEHLTGIPVDRDEYPPKDLEIAENAFLAYLEWEGLHDLKIIGSEIQLAHDELYYGGTIDLLAELDGGFALIDFKTTNALYPEHSVQLAAYAELIRFHHHEYPALHLLQLHKADGSFHHHHFKNGLVKEWDVFQHCLELHRLRNLVN